MRIRVRRCVPLRHVVSSGEPLLSRYMHYGMSLSACEVVWPTASTAAESGGCTPPSGASAPEIPAGNTRERPKELLVLSSLWRGPERQ